MENAEVLMERLEGLGYWRPAACVKAEAVGVEMAEGGRDGEIPPAALSWRFERRVVRKAGVDKISTLWTRVGISVE